MVSDAGNYPAGMVGGQTMLTYDSPKQAVEVILDMVSKPDAIRSISQRSWQLMKRDYNKSKQWLEFETIVAEL